MISRSKSMFSTVFNAHITLHSAGHGEVMRNFCQLSRWIQEDCHECQARMGYRNEPAQKGYRTCCLQLSGPNPFYGGNLMGFNITMKTHLWTCLHRILEVRLNEMEDPPQM